MGIEFINLDKYNKLIDELDFSKNNVIKLEVSIDLKPNNIIDIISNGLKIKNGFFIAFAAPRCNNKECTIKKRIRLIEAVMQEAEFVILYEPFEDFESNLIDEFLNNIPKDKKVLILICN